MKDEGIGKLDNFLLNEPSITQEEREEIMECVSKMQKVRKFFCLQRHFLGINQFDFYELEATEEDKAWNEIEESIAGNNSQEWLITDEERQTLIKLLSEKK
jgi:hypothetical protein